ncbi:hypothetical protein PENNAL_c0049G06879 [Penicillium nalgiovense]|uniref:F-box domain-containing protein n=1 Tax=Penicillium nalgiovense TaxID=60175 RepID=A0A1V6XXQ2_PENNA|nr:hypothetical protein PENNAL_c0049G06879 [Penicillium nalgiovense]
MVTTRNPTALTDLPLELLWMISEHSLPVDLASLALGNHRLLSSFAGTAFRDFTNGRNGNPTDDARIKLLSRLSRDLPQYYLCFICLRLHLWKNTRLPSYFHIDCSDGLEMNDRCLQTSLPLCHYPSYTYYQFRFVHLQLAMRRFYYGPGFGIPVESMLYTEVVRHHIKAKAPPWLQSPVNNISEKDPQKDVLMALFSAEARICSTSPGLCLRAQEIAVVARQNVPRMWPCHENGLVEICRHIHTREPGFIGIFTSQIERYCSKTSPIEPADQGSCDKCNTSWKLEMRTLDENNASLTLTRWIDLGPGLSPNDAQWRCRFGIELLLNAPNHEIVDSRQRFERDSIQANSSNALSEDEMYWRNISLLQGETYQKVMTSMRYGFYILHGEAKTSSSRCIIL